MRIGLISDTHNEKQSVKLALDIFREAGIDIILHAGDITNVTTLKLFAGFDVWIARGNMDRDHQLHPVARELFGVGHLTMMHQLRFNGTTLALTHGDSWSQLTSLIQSERFNYVIHGHTHVPQDEKVGDTRVINPGALGHSRWEAPTCAILNLEIGDLQWLKF